MSTARIDWSQLWFPGPARRYSAAEMARAGAEPPSATLKAVLGVNIGLLALVTLQFAPARHLAVLTALVVAASMASWAAARWLWWRPWRGPLFGASMVVTLGLAGIAIAARLLTADRELRVWLAGTLIATTMLACLGLWFLAVWRSDRIAARLNELDERERTAELSRRLLAAQVQPHFVFNTLAALGHWVDTQDPRAAPLLAAFTGYLRATLPLFDRTRLTLAEEAQAVRRYLEVMALRLGERLQWTMAVPAEAERATLPPGLLLTLVENAVAHGVEPQLHGGRVTIEARLSSPAGSDRSTGANVVTMLHVAVLDDGAGPTPGAADGTGLANVRGRLALAYGAAARFELTAGPQGGARAALEIPFETDTP